MTAQMQNPGWQAGASRDLLCVGWSRPSLTGLESPAQMLASRFCLSPWMALDLVQLCFGEGYDD